MKRLPKVTLPKRSFICPMFEIFNVFFTEEVSMKPVLPEIQSKLTDSSCFSVVMRLHKPGLSIFWMHRFCLWLTQPPSPLSWDSFQAFQNVPAAL
jgi:hypothetical protein